MAGSDDNSLHTKQSDPHVHRMLLRFLPDVFVEHDLQSGSLPNYGQITWLE